MHPVHLTDADMSSYSEHWYNLFAEEWCYVELYDQIDGGEHVTASVHNGLVKMSHGTEFGSVLNVVAGRQRFIAGPGAHGLRGMSWSGLWFVPSLPDAVTGANLGRYKFQRCCTHVCCPIAIELSRPSVIKRVPRSTMQCLTGQIGQQLEREIFRRLHFSNMYCQNYMVLVRQLVRDGLLTDSCPCRRCGCRICGAVSFSSR